MSPAPLTKYSNVAHVILGFLTKADEPLTGYDIKQWVDTSVRYFFAASFGQIYPELKKLNEAGLIDGRSNATGGRARTEYSITDAGRDELREWLLQPETRLEMRDEAVLRIFFSGVLTKQEKLAKHRQMRADRVRSFESLKAVHAAAEDQISEMPGLVLDYGLGLHEYVIDWCDRAIAAVEKNTA